MLQQVVSTYRRVRLSHSYCAMERALNLISIPVQRRAYGNTVAPNLITNLSGPKWAKTIAYLGVFIQVIVSFQVYASPIFEAFDTWFGDERVWSMKNILYRFVYR